MQESNIEIALISGGTSESSLNRAKRLQIKYCFFDIKDKLKKLKELKENLKLKKSEILYLGDDLNDLPVKDFVGLFTVPRDANNIVKKKANIILENNGGQGAVRELAEILLSSKNHSKLIFRFGWIGKN